jgi:leucyl/phenylalanyl-tRNA--protein transferase
MTIYLPSLTDDYHDFPPIASALEQPNGLLAIGGDLQPQRIIAAYQRGIFPWYGEGDPILWWSPNPRCILKPSNIKVSRSLKKVRRHKGFAVSFDQAFVQVIGACRASTPSRPSTWINPQMQHAYTQLFHQGYAHSVEVWQDQQLQGGLYGLSLGRIFFGESMFSRTSDASKIALVALCERLVRANYLLIDCQVANPHLLSLGATLIDRTAFQDYLLRGITQSEQTATGFELTITELMKQND